MTVGVQKNSTAIIVSHGGFGVVQEVEWVMVVKALALSSGLAKTSSS